jgi:hypothetical protein
MEFKGTKGHWEARGSYVYKLNETHEISTIITHNGNKDEAEANAKLISCAPEMLKMLNDILEQENISQSAFDEINDLIKKATI